ncbi:HNH endonuclease [Demequina sp. SO4-13]|uniref:HNH endonuclease n=1 Tax=Demequina sp. SO4-13 TaxID=3401027 RepID=UPI003AF6C635
MKKRKSIPRAVQRQVKVEAGHRCAVPTCRATSGLEIHHIREHARGGPDEFQNLILLCAVCHARVTRGEIDRTSVKAYKANLALLNSRYGDLERRVLSRFTADPELETVVVDVAQKLALDYLIDDGILEYRGSADGAVFFQVAGGPGPDEATTNLESHFGPAKWGLTEEGQQFVEQLRGAQTVE